MLKTKTKCSIFYVLYLMSLGLAMNTPKQSYASSYDWILFDADDTLFSFDSFVGLKHMFRGYGVDFGQEEYVEYQKVNKVLWIDLQKGNITQKELQNTRFKLWAERINASREMQGSSTPGVTTEELNNAFLDSMAITSVPLEGVGCLLENLRGKAKLGIITNGFSRLQHVRLQNLGLTQYFEVLVISEQVGIAKPNRGIFDFALAQMNHPDREKVLMVGDTLESDIQGGINAGIHTCWLNTHRKPANETITPTYEVFSTKELSILLELLLGNNGLDKNEESLVSTEGLTTNNSSI